MLMPTLSILSRLCLNVLLLNGLHIMLLLLTLKHLIKMDLIFILRSCVDVKTLGFILLEHLGLGLVDGFLNVHADDVLKILIDVMLDAELLCYLLRVVVLVDSELLLLPVSDLNRHNEQLSGVFAIFGAGKVRVILAIRPLESGT